MNDTSGWYCTKPPQPGGSPSFPQHGGVEETQEGADTYSDLGALSPFLRQCPLVWWTCTLSLVSEVSQLFEHFEMSALKNWGYLPKIGKTSLRKPTGQASGTESLIQGLLHSLGS